PRHRATDRRWPGRVERDQRPTERRAWQFSSPTGAARNRGHVPGLYNTFTTYLRYLYGSFMTAVIRLRILFAASKSGGPTLLVLPDAPTAPQCAGNGAYITLHSHA